MRELNSKNSPALPKHNFLEFKDFMAHIMGIQIFSQGRMWFISIKVK